NVAVYDNRFTNVCTASSFDPLYGGPYVVARNLYVNVCRGPHKWNSASSGHFHYNNTYIRTDTFYSNAAEAGWYKTSSGAPQESFGYRNNLHVYRGPGDYTIRVDQASGFDTLDFGNSAWYPDLLFRFEATTYDDLADIQADIGTSTPIISDYTKAFENDVLTVTNPWNETVTLGMDYQTEITTYYDLTLADGDNARNAGVAIPNITDGFTGAAPVIGHAIHGRAEVAYGDQTPDASVPTYISSLSDYEVFQITSATNGATTIAEAI